jgi:CRP-like cAMP-binding protein
VLGGHGTPRVLVPEEYLQSVDFISGSCIIRQGEPCDGCYILDAGRVRLELEDRQTGTDTVLGILEPGSVLGELTLVDDKRYSASAYAVGHVRAHWLARQSFQNMCLRDLGICLRVASALGHDLTGQACRLDQKTSNYVFGRGAEKETPNRLSSVGVEQELVDQRIRGEVETAARLYGWSGLSRM